MNIMDTYNNAVRCLNTIIDTVCALYARKIVQC